MYRKYPVVSLKRTGFILNFYIKTRFSLKKIVLCIENPVVKLKKNVFARKD